MGFEIATLYTILVDKRLLYKWFLVYKAEKKSWYVVARFFFLALLSFSAWPCLAVA